MKTTITYKFLEDTLENFYSDTNVSREKCIEGLEEINKRIADYIACLESEGA